MRMPVIILILVFVASVTSFAQSDPGKIVAAESAFAKLAAEKGTRTAFLANMTDEAVVFNPERANAKEDWTKRGESKSLLSWAANFADSSSGGAIRPRRVFAKKA